MMKDYYQNQLIAAAAELLPPEWNNAAIALFRVGTGSDQSDWKIVLTERLRRFFRSAAVSQSRCKSNQRSATQCLNCSHRTHGCSK